MTSRSQDPSSTTASATKSKTRKTSTKSAESANAPAFSAQDDMRVKWIAEAAYFIAERRGFSGGSPSDDWLEAEAEIDRMLAATRH